MIYQREREIQERQTFHRKQQLKDALANGKNLPTELRRDAVNLGKDLQFDEAQVGEFFACVPVDSFLFFVIFLDDLSNVYLFIFIFIF